MTLTKLMLLIVSGLVARNVRVFDGEIKRLSAISSVMAECTTWEF